MVNLFELKWITKCTKNSNPIKQPIVRIANDEPLNLLLTNSQKIHVLLSIVITFIFMQLITICSYIIQEGLGQSS